MESAELRQAKARVRESEQAVWRDVERVGADLRRAEGARMAVTQAEADTSKQPAKASRASAD